MKKVIFSLAFIATAIIAIYSCKPDEEPTPPDVSTTVLEDKANIDATFDEIVSCLTTYKDGDFVQGIVDMMGVDQGGTSEDWFIEIADSLYQVVDFDHIDVNGYFDFAHHAGTYTYNHGSNTWSKSATPTNMIVVEFPSDSTQTSNNMEISITEYTSQAYTVNAATEYMPTSGSYTIKKDGNVLHSFSINNIAWQQLTDVAIPTDVSITIVTAPYTISIDGRKVDDFNFEAGISVSNGSGCTFAMEGTLEVSNSDYENLTDDDLVAATAEITVNDLTVTGNAPDLATFIAIVDPTDAQVNSMLDFDVLYQGVKIADIEVENASDSLVDPSFNLVYKDGSSEVLDDAYIQPFLDDLEVALFDLFGNW